MTVDCKAPADKSGMGVIKTANKEVFFVVESYCIFHLMNACIDRVFVNILDVVQVCKLVYQLKTVLKVVLSVNREDLLYLKVINVSIAKQV